MLHAKDLMVGDWVRVNHDGLCIRKDTIVEVRAIDADDKLEKNGLIGTAHCRPLDDDQFEGGIWCEYLEPIQLTPEILEKNGFTYYEIYGCFVLPTTISYGSWDVDVSLFNVTNEYRNNQLHIATPDDSITLLHIMECNHIHELQHALRLCGIEKEVEL